MSAKVITVPHWIISWYTGHC